MGAVLQTAGAAELAAELTCCACSSVCGLIARNASTRAKFRYWSLLLMATVTCIVLLIPGLRQKVYKIPNFCNKIVSPDTCDKLIGFSAVYRILFSLTVFHFVLAIFTMRISRVKSCRAKLNNGLWIFKLVLISGITCGSFYIPKQTGFFRIWMYISLTGGFMFAMFQILLVIDFGNSWSISWANRLENGYTKLWYLAMTIVTFILFAMSGVSTGSFYLFFTHPPDMMKCQANVFFIGFITIQCFVASIVSITPTVQRELSGAGLLQSSVVVLYTMYLTFNTLIAEPDSLCNPVGSLMVEYDSFTGVSGQTIFGCMVTLALLVFAFTVRTNTSHLGKYGLSLAESEEFAMIMYHEDKHKQSVEKELDDGGKEILLDEYVGHNYSFFHLIMSLASLHILMVITNWHSPDENSNLKKLVKNWASVWVQMASSFVCILVYIWFLVTPLVKKVWGPLFGIYEQPNRNRKKRPAGKPNPNTGPNGDQNRKHGGERTPLTNHIDMPRHPPPVNRESSEQNKEANKDNSSPRDDTADAGTKRACPAEASIKEQPRAEKRLEQRTNIERPGSASTHTSKKQDLRSVRSNQQDNDVNNRRNDKRRKHDDVTYSSNNSIVSVLSSHVMQKLSGSRSKMKTREKRGKNADSELLCESKTPSASSIQTYSRPQSKIERSHGYHGNRSKQNKRLNSRTSCMDEDEENNTKIETKRTKRLPKLQEMEETILEEKIKNYNDSAQALSTRASAANLNVSLVPSAFSKRPQDPDVAREILQIQWKILRSQAKMVKIQERIIRLQAEADANKEIASAKPAHKTRVSKNNGNRHTVYYKKEPG